MAEFQIKIVNFKKQYKHLEYSDEIVLEWSYEQRLCKEA